ncbi:hypothetical protein ZWY2020_044919 [Hordeum vulgare]|nr:hypothetical protein ZWY2020_044919 [Hordeum vulgare]
MGGGEEVYLVGQEEEWGDEEEEPVFVLTEEWAEFFAKANAKRRLGKSRLVRGRTARVPVGVLLLKAEAEGAGGAPGGGEAVRRAVAESPVLVVGRRGCCLSHVVKRLLQGLDVNPAVHEVADEAEHAAVFTGDEVVVARSSSLCPRCSWALWLWLWLWG